MSEIIRKNLDRLFASALDLDVETWGLGRGSGMHEVAISGKGAVLGKEGYGVRQWRLDPNLTTVESPAKQNLYKLASSASDKHSPSVALEQLKRTPGYTPKWTDVDKIHTAIMRDYENTQLFDSKSGVTPIAGDARKVSALTNKETLDFLRTNNNFRFTSYEQQKYWWMTYIDPVTHEVTNPFHKGLGIPGGPNMPDDQAARIIRHELEAQGVEAHRMQHIRSTRGAIDSLVGRESEFARTIRNKTLWIASAHFEAKQFGAAIAVEEEAVKQRLMRQGHTEVDAIKKAKQSTVRAGMSWQNPGSPDVFNVNDPIYTRTRSMAQRGVAGVDFTDVYKTMHLETRLPGTHVRDVFDLVKAEQDFARKLNIINLPKGQYIPGGIDVLSRLHRAGDYKGHQAVKAFSIAETHTAYSDTTSSQHLVRTRTARSIEVMKQVAENTHLGKEYVLQAKAGKGPLLDIYTRLNRQQAIANFKSPGSVVSQIDRAIRDISLQGFSRQSAGSKEIFPTQESISGRRTRVSTSVPSTREVSSIADAVEAIGARHGDRDLVTREWDAMRRHLVGTGSLGPEGMPIKGQERALIAHSQAYMMDSVSKHDVDAFARKMQTEGDLSKWLSSTRATRSSASQLRSIREGAGNIFKGKAGRVGGAAGALYMGVAGLGMLTAVMEGPKRNRTPASILSVNYKNWLENQEDFHGMEAPPSQNEYGWQSGMQKRGVGAASRRLNTDFGSPYQGPMAANGVLYDQQILAEREKYLREVYQRIHNDPASQDIFNYFKISAATSIGHHYVKGSDVEHADSLMYPSLRGENLLRINLSKGNWKVTAEDADTITIRRGGFKGSVSDFFGQNQSYSFRLAGIDAPETMHGEIGMRRAQPHADDATKALQAMIGKSGKLDIVYDPSNVTYGRMVGALMVDGKNANFELLRQGHAALLPFYKEGTKPMVDYEAMRKIESRARNSERGMWSEPFFQAYADITAGGDRITFNTFSRVSETAKNATTMSARALMWNAQDMGFYNTATHGAQAQALNTLLKERGREDDYGRPSTFNWTATPHNSYMAEMMRDSAELMKTRGTASSYRTSRRSGYGSLDKKLVLDSMSSTNIWNKRRHPVYDVYNVKNGRNSRFRDAYKHKVAMAESQRLAMASMMMSSQNHHVM